MNKLQAFWHHVPRRVRQGIVLILGLLFVLAAVITSPIPGPGGIPLFLIGIAILATEFEWAQRLRDRILVLVRQLGDWFRSHVQYTINIIAIFASVLALGLILYFTSR
ncbi:MAG: hypothetical protein JWM37_895 [Candidatus Saccharibacteria bacterium]|nr:hypothetical protein [Candidatus Saccharibacteria bacterium]